MPSLRIGLLLFAVAAASGAAPREAAAETLSDTKDELARGDWRGEKEWTDQRPAGGGTPTPAPGGSSPPSGGGTATPPATGGGEPSPTGTATEPTGPSPDGGTGEDEPFDPLDPTGPTSPYEPETPTDPAPAGTPAPPPPPPTGPVGTPVVPSCQARWTCKVNEPAPVVYDARTLLTFTLFRSDAFAFICNEYCRSESTWYVDVFATTVASYDGMSMIDLAVELANPCPNCQPEIDLLGISLLDAKVQLKTIWWSLSEDTTAHALVGTTWAGDLDCSDGVWTSAAGGTTTGEYTVGAEPIKFTRKTSSSYVYEAVAGGKGDKNMIKRSKASVAIVNRGSVKTTADDTEENAQAKVRSAYRMEIQGRSRCGPQGTLKIVVKE